MAGFLGMYRALDEPAPQAQPQPRTTSPEIRDLQHEVERLRLINQSMWELLREHLKLNDEALEAKIREVDLRDGVEDGRMTGHALKCPRCERISHSKHWKCLYCGLKFKRPVAG